MRFWIFKLVVSLGLGVLFLCLIWPYGAPWAIGVALVATGLAMVFFKRLEDGSI